ncbi:MAG: hypothetical protein J1E83_06235 [Lachnospiraceae bacterium]|nr:hypothetical protein [Lachnospiraceae bacterium]
MIQTYDFIFKAKYDQDFMKVVQDAVSSNENCEINTDRHKLNFDAKSQMVIITPNLNTGIYNKIIPKKIKYKALMKMLKGEWDNFAPDDVADI